MWFSTRRFLRIKLKFLSQEQLAELRRELTAALILTTEETEKRYRDVLERVDACPVMEPARASLAKRADYLQAARSFLSADILWPSLPLESEMETHAVDSSEKAAPRH